MDIINHKMSLQQTLKGVESKIVFLGPGPHNQQQTEELRKLTDVKQKLLEQIRVASAQEKTTQQASPVPSSSPAMQHASPMLASTSLSTPHAAISKSQPHVVLSKPRAPVPPYMIQTQVKPDNKILNKLRLQELVKEVDPSQQLDEDVEEMLMQITDDFIESVVSASCDLAKHRKSNTLELVMKVDETGEVNEKRWNITIPGYGSDEVKTFKKSTTTDAHKQRLALIRKATKK